MTRVTRSLCSRLLSSQFTLRIHWLVQGEQCPRRQPDKERTVDFKDKIVLFEVYGERLWKQGPVR